MTDYLYDNMQAMKDKPKLEIDDRLQKKQERHQSFLNMHTICVMPRTPLRIASDSGTELLMVIEGSGEARIGNTITAYEAGQVFLLSANAIATFSTKYIGKTIIYAASFYPKEFAAASADTQEKALIKLLISTQKGLNLLPCATHTFAQLEKCHILISAQQSEARPFSQRIMGHMSMAFLLSIAREGRLDNTFDASGVLGCVENAVQIVHLRFAEALTLSLIAQELGISSPYLSTLFKQRTGLSFSQFLTNERIMRAKQMLLDSEELITQIAQSSGFGSSAHFGYVFRKCTNCSPLRYRKANRTVGNDMP